MTQPTQPPAKGGNIITRRIGPLPAWLWLLLVVLLAFVYLRLHNAKKNTNANSDATQSPNLTNQPSTLSTWVSDVFVNIKDTPPTGPPGGPRTPPVVRPPDQPPPTQLPAPPATTPPPARTTSITYTVKSGDTLTGIAKKLGKTWADLYYPNQSLLDAVAKQHGYSSNPNGKWIFPGEQLVIPT